MAEEGIIMAAITAGAFIALTVLCFAAKHSRKDKGTELPAHMEQERMRQ